MTDYIKRKTALEDFERCNAENPNWTPQRVKTLLLRQPAADVAEVVHGRWIWNEEGEIDWEQFYRCSNCGVKEYWESNYCPNCGAKMDGGDNNSDIT